jgi:hypothetical protein
MKDIDDPSFIVPSLTSTYARVYEYIYMCVCVCRVLIKPAMEGGAMAKPMNDCTCVVKDNLPAFARTLARAPSLSLIYARISIIALSLCICACDAHKYLNTYHLQYHTIARIN